MSKYEEMAKEYAENQCLPFCQFWTEDMLSVNIANSTTDCLAGIRMGIEMAETLFNQMGEFALKTFPDATSTEHLLKLEQEVAEAIAEPQNLKEYVDCLLALYAAIHKAGFTYSKLTFAGFEKLEIVKARKWEKQNDGTYQHIF
jgi:hypothetical protein